MSDSVSEEYFRRCETPGKIKEKILVCFGALFSLGGALSILRLLKTEYDNPLLVTVERLVEIYENVMNDILSHVDVKVADLLYILEINLDVPPHWKHLFVFMIFFLSGLRYTPRRYCKAAFVFKVWGFLVALVVSVISVLLASSFADILGLFLSTFTLIVGLYFYYFPLHLWRATFDRPIELAFYKGEEEWGSYFLRQQRDLINVPINYGLAFVIMLLFARLIGVHSTVPLLLIFFALVVTIRFAWAGYKQALQWQYQPTNEGRPFLKVLLSAANIRSSIHYFFAILMVAGAVASGFVDSLRES